MPRWVGTVPMHLRDERKEEGPFKRNAPTRPARVTRQKRGRLNRTDRKTQSRPLTKWGGEGKNHRAKRMKAAGDSQGL